MDFECHLGAENLFVGFTFNMMGKFKKLSWKYTETIISVLKWCHSSRANWFG